MVLRSCYYTTSQVARLKKLAEQLKKKESVLLREALDDLLRKYDVTWSRRRKRGGDVGVAHVPARCALVTASGRSASRVPSLRSGNCR